MVDPDGSILILYGSETGNAQDAAEELGRVCQRLRWETTVEELNAVELVRHIHLRSAIEHV
jgi:flavodoxin